MHEDLFSATVDFHGNLVRNIPGIRQSQDLFDDLSDDAADRDIAAAAEAAARPPSAAPLITRPFDYGSVVTYSIPWRPTST